MGKRTLEELIEDSWYLKITTREESDRDDYRCEFANGVAQLIFDKVGNDVDKALEEWSKFDGMFEEYVRNIYEVDNGIPLKHLYHFTSNDWTGFDFENVEEYNMYVEYIKEKCLEFYKA